MPIDRATFLVGRPTLKTALVDVPEFGPEAQILLEELTALEKGKVQGGTFAWEDGEMTLNEAAMAESDIKIVMASARSAPGVPLFEDADKGTLSSYGGELIGRIADAARKLSGLDKSAKKTKEHAKGN